jgi:hypothetical protein
VFLKHLFDEDNGDDICIAKIMAVVAFITYVGYVIYGLTPFGGSHFAVGEFANGLMQVLGGSAAVIGTKNATTKHPQDPAS